MNWKLAGMAGTAAIAVALSGYSAVAGANKFTGNISLAAGQTWVNTDPTLAIDDSFASLSGSGNLNIAFSNNINLQLGMKGEAAFIDSNGIDRKDGFQVDAHVYTRNDTYAVGVFGGVGSDSVDNSDSADHYFVGVEGQYYWNNFTFGLNGGYLDSNSTGSPSDEYLNNAWFVGGEVRWYATPKVTVTANLGYIDGEAFFGSADTKTVNWGLKAEYWPEEKEPLSLFVAYEGRTSDADFGGFDPSKDTHTVKVGVTFHFGVDGGSQDNDRSGPAFNTQDYGNVVVGG
jgi:hypothetical protein